MSSKLLQSTIIFTLYGLGATAISQPQPPWLSVPADEMAGAFINSEDSNGDGEVSQSEFKGPAEDFAFLDQNGDGVISLEEGPTPDRLPPGLSIAQQVQSREVTINNIVFNIPYELFTWNTLPGDVEFERQPIEVFTNESGDQHYYEVIYLPDGNLNWYQAAKLAQESGGYLASINSDDENMFVFSLVSDKKYFWFFPEDGGHYGISIGPFLGGYQPEGSPEPDGGWSWLSGEAWDYTNWAVNLDDGVIDKDPRPSDQPNDSGQGQPIMGFGEMNVPVPTWGDYMANIGTYGISKLPGRSYGFIIEYEQNPATE